MSRGGLRGPYDPHIKCGAHSTESTFQVYRQTKSPVLLTWRVGGVPVQTQYKPDTPCASLWGPVLGMYRAISTCLDSQYAGDA